MLAAPQAMAEEHSVKEVKFYYQNWRGEKSLRIAVPVEIWFGTTEWHPAPQWFLKATDVEKGEERDFALVDMKFVTD